MPEKILVGVAWPYSNGSLHIGQIVGAYLPADIFARYHRAAGNDVLMVSGSDQHGTPITVRAEQEGQTPADVAVRFHEDFLDSWHRLGISWDLYTTTGTDNHARVVHDIFLRLLEKGDIYKGSMKLPFCAVEQRFLLDRYVEGTCPICGDPNARGDQCDACGNVLDPIDLVDRRCRFDGSTPEIRESEHFFLRLSAYNDKLKRWLSAGKEHWRKNVLNFSLGVLQQGLQDRAITRDLEWGIPIPLEGYDSKRIYVWFENVVGYLSATLEWAPPPRPGPAPPPSSPAPTIPELSDPDFPWTDFTRRNNDELVATWGNLANRVLAFAYKNWEGRVPDSGPLEDQDRELTALIDAGFETVGRLIEAVQLRAALAEALALARAVNGYLDRAPWFSVVKKDKERAGTTVYTALRAIDSLSVLLAPFLPFSSERLHP